MNDLPKNKPLRTLHPQRRGAAGGSESETEIKVNVGNGPVAEHDSEFDGPQLNTSETLDQSVSLVKTVKRHRRSLSSFSISLMIHSVLVLLMILMVRTIQQTAPEINITAAIEAKPVNDHPTDFEMNTIEIVLPDHAQSPLEMQAEDIATDEKIEIAENLNTLINSITPSVVPTPSVIEATPQPALTLPTGGGLTGRDATARARLAASSGGSPASELAVENGLRWIILHQQADGSWRLHHGKGECAGRCPNEGTMESTTAATGLALLALLGAGYTHQAGPYQKEVQAGLDYLRSRIRMTPRGGTFGDLQQPMYAQAIATMAMAEACNMTRDTRLMNLVESSRKYIASRQYQPNNERAAGRGSWSYLGGTRGDITVTGWQLMALKSCELAGFATERETWQNAESFLDSLVTSRGHYGYKTADEGNLTTTSIGVLSKMYLGTPLEHWSLHGGAEAIFDAGPSETDIYFDYYATQIMHHLAGPNWTSWNKKMRDHLVATQVTGAGHADGSWYFENPHGKVGGRLYTTAMSVMILEVYYRYLPLYEEKAVENVGRIFNPTR